MNTTNLTPSSSFALDSATYIVDEYAKLLAWANNAPGNDYTVVYIKGYFSISKGFDLVASKTKRIYGEAGSTIEFIEAPYGFRYRYPYDVEFSITGLRVEGYEMSGPMFDSCSNVSNCYAQIDGRINHSCFQGCYNLSSCYAKSLTTTLGVCYSGCTGLVGCHAGPSLEGFSECSQLTNCYVTSATRGYELCNTLTTCGARYCDYGYRSCQYMSTCNTVDTTTIGYAECDYLTGCRSVGGLYGFNTCRYLTSCIGDGRTYSYNGCVNMILNQGNGTNKYNNCKVIPNGANVSATSEGGFNT